MPEVRERALAERGDRDLDLVALDRPHHRRRHLLRGRGAEARRCSCAPDSANIPASRTNPGETIETPTPVPARSARRPSAKPRSPNLVAL